MYKSRTVENQSTNKGSEGGPSVKSSYNKAWHGTKVVVATAVLATILLLQGLVVMCFTLLCFPIYVLASLLKELWTGIVFVANFSKGGQREPDQDISGRPAWRRYLSGCLLIGLLPILLLQELVVMCFTLLVVCFTLLLLPVYLLASFLKAMCTGRVFVGGVNEGGQREPDQDIWGHPAWRRYLSGCLVVGLLSPFILCVVLCISLKSLCMLTYRCMTNYFKALTSFYNKCMEQSKLETEEGCSNLWALVIESFCEQFSTYCKELKQCWCCNGLWEQKVDDPSNPQNPSNFDLSSYLEQCEREFDTVTVEDILATMHTSAGRSF